MSLEEVQVKFTTDSSDVDRGLKNTKKGIFGLKQATNQLGLDKAFDKAQVQLENLNKQMALNTQKMAQYQKEAARLRDIIAKPPKTDTSALDDQLANLRAKSDSLYDRIISKQNQIASLQQQTGLDSAMGKDPAINTASLQKAQADLVSLNAQFDRTITGIEKVEQALSTGGESPALAKAKDDLLQVEGAMLRLERANASTLGQYRKVEEQLSGVGTASKKAAFGLKAVGEEAKKAGNKAQGPLGKIGKMLSQAVRSAVLMAAAYKLIRGAMKYLTDGLKTNKQFAESLNAIKVNLATAFQPIYEAILPAINTLMSWLAKATQAIAIFMSALFGTTYAASKEAAAGLNDAKEAMEGYGGAAAETKRQLAGFDKFNDITAQKTGGGGGSAAGSGIDFSKVEPPDLSWIDELSAKLEPIKNYFKDKILIAFEIAKEPLLNAYNEVKLAAENMGTLGSSFVSGFSQAIIDGAPKIDSAITNAFIAAGNLTAVGAIHTEAYFGGFNDAFDSRKEELTTAFHDGMYDITTGSIDLYATGTEAMAKFTGGLKDGFESFKEWLRAGWEGLWGGVFDAAKLIWDGITSAWTQITTTISDALTDIMPYIEKFGQTFGEVFSVLWSVIGPILGAIIENVGGILGNAFERAGDIISGAVDMMIGIIGGLMRAFSGLWEFIKNVFTGNWNAAWEGLKEFFLGIWDAIVAAAKGSLNLIINALNFVWSAIYTAVKGIINTIGSLAGAIGDLLGLNWHFSMPAEPPLIPRLAQGGMAYGQVQAIVGDNFNARQDPEVISPLSNLQQMITSAMLQRDITGGGNRDMRLTLVLDNGEVLADMLIDPMNQTAKNQGYAPVFKPA